MPTAEKIISVLGAPPQPRGLGLPGTRDKAAPKIEPHLSNNGAQLLSPYYKYAGYELNDYSYYTMMVLSHPGQTDSSNRDATCHALTLNYAG